MKILRRKALLSLGGIVAGGGVLVGTSAFTTVQAERTVSVETAGDANAFLAIDTISDSQNSQDYASFTSSDTLEVDITGVSLEAVTVIDRVFKLTNNGTQAVVIYLEEIPGGNSQYATSTDFGVLADELSNPQAQSDLQYPILGSDRVSISSSTPPDNGGYEELGVLLDVGESIEIGIYIDTSDNNIGDGLDESSGLGEASANEELLDGVIIYASATEAENDNYRFDSKPS